MFQSTLNGYNRAALAEAMFDVENDLFNEGGLICAIYGCYMLDAPMVTVYVYTHTGMHPVLLQIILEAFKITFKVNNLYC